MRAMAEAVRVLATWVAAMRVEAAWVVAATAEMVVRATVAAVRAMVEAATAMAGAARAGMRAWGAKARGGAATDREDREAGRTAEVGLVAATMAAVVTAEAPLAEWAAQRVARVVQARAVAAARAAAEAKVTVAAG